MHTNPQNAFTTHHINNHHHTYDDNLHLECFLHPPRQLPFRCLSLCTSLHVVFLLASSLEGFLRSMRSLCQCPGQVGSFGRSISVHSISFRYSRSPGAGALCLVCQSRFSSSISVERCMSCWKGHSFPIQSWFGVFMWVCSHSSLLCYHMCGVPCFFLFLFLFGGSRLSFVRLWLPCFVGILFPHVRCCFVPLLSIQTPSCLQR